MKFLRTFESLIKKINRIKNNTKNKNLKKTFLSADYNTLTNQEYIFAFQNPKKGGDVSESDAGVGAEEIKINMSQPSTPSIAKTLGGGGKSVC